MRPRAEADGSFIDRWRQAHEANSLDEASPLVSPDVAHEPRGEFTRTGMDIQEGKGGMANASSHQALISGGR